ncbi:hypothetical protein GYMLUDRAFT_88498 [Collybiopsis luxurians FD-317 M1]|uniref:NAD(P)-binding protein n=1 Tax=Collybiopsis luxurians FD-317 M1 TaxID=944289 RepID=A0A0D0C5E3_9AGAR|nr:hypothetical protein GYMLUDRAFT_88498 [Collybiopsis luxurians FD-317 M1]
MARPRVWLITGATAGFGRAVAEVALSQGEIVSATGRNLEALQDLKNIYGADKLLISPCDVTSNQQIVNAFAATITQFSHLDVVLHCPGYAVIGEIESTPEEVARKLFEVNFWGTAAVCREAVRVFREQGSGGRLLTMSSVAGYMGLPALGYYSASKHAIEGMVESLAKEMIPQWNIKISILQPGSFKTDAFKNYIFLPALDVYSNPVASSYGMRKYMEDGSFLKGDVTKAASQIFEFTKLDNPPLRWQIGKDSVMAFRKQCEESLKESESLERWSDNV